MKWTIYILLAFAGISTYSQEKNVSAADAKLEISALPEIVIKKAGEDFSVYVRDPENVDPKIKNLQDAFVAYDLGRDYEGFERYLVTMENKGAKLVATYNEKGKLTSVVERYDDVRLPMPVIYSVYRAFPGWQMVKDKYLYTQEDGDVKQKQYNIKLTKAGETKKLVINAKGEILASL